MSLDLNLLATFPEKEKNPDQYFYIEFLDEILNGIRAVPLAAYYGVKGKSGNFGHAGRKGKIGGSAPRSGGISIDNYPADVKDISMGQFMAQAEYSDIFTQMEKNLSEIRGGTERSLQTVNGDIDADNANVIVQNMKNTLTGYSGYLAGDSMNRARDYIDSFEGSLKKGVQDGSLKGIKADDLNKMGQDNIKKMLHQEVESNRQAFTDHGIRHITGNIIRQKVILNEMDPTNNGKKELMADFIMVNHDVGYTTPLIRAGGIRGVMTTKHHPAFSEKIAQQQSSQWNEGKIFSKSEYNEMTGIIRTHDSTVIDTKNWLATSTRLSDNLSLFNSEKLPSMFQYVKGGDKSLVAMGIAAKKGNDKAFDAAQKTLYRKIDNSNLSFNLKRDLKAATREINHMTPKFTMGVLAGHITEVKNKGGKLNIDVRYNKYDSFLQKHFDMGQKQTRKLMEDYGITDYTKTKYDLGKKVTIKVKGAPKYTRRWRGPDGEWRYEYSNTVPKYPSS